MIYNNITNMYHKNFGKDYFKKVQRERRENDPLYQKKVVYVVEIDGKTATVADFKADPDIIKCF